MTTLLTVLLFGLVNSVSDTEPLTIPAVKHSSTPSISLQHSGDWLSVPRADYDGLLALEHAFANGVYITINSEQLAQHMHTTSYLEHAKTHLRNAYPDFRLLQERQKRINSMLAIELIYAAKIDGDRGPVSMIQQTIFVQDTTAYILSYVAPEKIFNRYYNEAVAILESGNTDW